VVALDVHPLRRVLATGALDGDRTVKVWTQEAAPGDAMVARRDDRSWMPAR
jgi:hypothetical protein